MNIVAIKTEKILPGKANLQTILKKSLPRLVECSIVAITSKIISLSEGNIVKTTDVDKQILVSQEADFVLPLEPNLYNITLTIAHNTLIPNAGIDESNGSGHYILWPKNPQKSANSLRTFLKKEYGVNEVGVIITDSKTTPLRRGTTGVALAHSGFLALHDYRDTPDLFGKKLAVTLANHAEGLAGAAVVMMGEGSEQTPIAVITDAPFVRFQDRNPSSSELENLQISLKEDLYAPILTAAPWKSGKIAG